MKKKVKKAHGGRGESKTSTDKKNAWGQGKGGSVGGVRAPPVEKKCSRGHVQEKRQRQGGGVRGKN